MKLREIAFFWAILTFYGSVLIVYCLKIPEITKSSYNGI